MILTQLSRLTSAARCPPDLNQMLVHQEELNYELKLKLLQDETASHSLEKVDTHF